LHVIPAGEPLHHRIAGAVTRDEMSSLLDALRRSYSHIIVDAGALGGAGEFFAEMADAIVLLARPHEEENYLHRTAERLESYRDAPVFVMNEEGGSEYSAANDSYPADLARNA